MMNILELTDLRLVIAKEKNPHPNMYMHFTFHTQQ